jgi:predicted N-acetyltransferase YhbS
MVSVTYSSNINITASQFIDVLRRSTLAERRPVDEVHRIEKMLEHADILVSAWHGDKLVGVSRALTDFCYCCYLSDLAVDQAYQHQGIGRELVRLTKEAAGEDTSLVLLAAPAAQDYYPKIGMEKFEHCFMIKRKSA